jgi:hypothetical protein
VEADRINFLLSNPTEANLEDTQMLEQEVAKYPYAQVLHVLLAKIKHLQKANDKNKKLTTAAIYSSNRSVLKRAILEEGYLEDMEEIVPFQELRLFDLEQVAAEEPEIFSEKESASIFDEVLKNLEKLKSLRKQFQFLELNEELTKEKEVDTSQEIPSEKDKKSPEDEVAPKKSKSSSKKGESKKKKLDKILEKDELLDSKVNVYYLKEIEEKKSALAGKSSTKHSTQSEIIEKFIETQPSIGAIRHEPESEQDLVNKDLSEKSTKFGDDLISENLAVILLRQGKKGRAIDIYKKLIWKLPQKKAYFAARIEEIKK